VNIKITLPRVTYERNASWFNSVAVALKVAVGWAPTRFVANVILPILVVLSGLGLLVMGMLAFVLSTAGILLLGLVGHINEDRTRKATI